MQKETKYLIIIAAAFLILAVVAFFIGKKAGYSLKSETQNSIIKLF